VVIYESFPELKILGDIISFGPNAGRIFTRWGDDKAVAKQMRDISIDLTEHGFRIHKYTGEHVITQKTPPQDMSMPVFNGHRGELHEIVFNHAKDDLGIPIHLNKRVRNYFENDDEAGIVFEDGEKVRLLPFARKAGCSVISVLTQGPRWSAML